MPEQNTIMLVAAGLLGGVVNALAGGATLLTFPTMLAVGLPPVAANASNAVAISPGHLIAALVDYESLPKSRRVVAVAVLICCLGGLCGALLLLVLPVRAFVLPVPALIAIATFLFAAAPRLQARALHRQPGDRSLRRGAFASMGVASIYGGYFGAGLGVILTTIVALVEPLGIREIKALKNLLAASVSVAAIVIFVANGVVVWGPTLVMLVGTLLGGIVGGHLLRRLPAFVVRWAVIVAGTSMSVIYARLYWF